MDIIELYEDEQFNNLLEIIAHKKRISSFDDFRQDVFLEITEHKYKTMSEYRRAANRVASRYFRERRNDDIMSLAYESESGEIETDDEVMARVVHSGKGRYV